MATNLVDQIYEKIITHAKPMDIIFLGSNDLIGKLIKKAQEVQTKDHTPSLWSHVCLYVDKDTIIESTLGFEPYRNGSRWDNGVQYYSLRNRIASSAYNCALAQLNLTTTQRRKIHDKANDLFAEGVTYPVLGLFGSLLTYWLFPKWRDNPLDNEHKSLYCSAFVARCYTSCDIILDPPGVDYAIDNISPEILWQGVKAWKAHTTMLSQSNKFIG